MTHITLPFALVFAISTLCNGQDRMREPIPKVPFTEADIRAAIELLEPSPRQSAAQLAREITATIRLAESVIEEYNRDPEGYVKLHSVPPGYTPIPGVALSPDLLMMLSIVSPELNIKVRAYMADSGLITGPLAERWEASRERMIHDLAQKRDKP